MKNESEQKMKPMRIRKQFCKQCAFEFPRAASGSMKVFGYGTRRTKLESWFCGIVCLKKFLKGIEISYWQNVATADKEEK